MDTFILNSVIMHFCTHFLLLIQKCVYIRTE